MSAYEPEKPRRQSPLERAVESAKFSNSVAVKDAWRQLQDAMNMREIWSEATEARAGSRHRTEPSITAATALLHALREALVHERIERLTAMQKGGKR